MQNIKNFKDWVNVQEMFSGNTDTCRLKSYIYLHTTPNLDYNSYYEIQILYWAEDTDILTAKASLFKCTEKDTGKNGILFERGCILEGQPVFECLDAAANGR